MPGRSFLIYIAAVCWLLFNGPAADAQQLIRPGEMEPPPDWQNLHLEPLYSDSLSSSFIIWIKEVVPLHLHAHHTEQVFVLQGEAEMVLGTDTLMITTGDFITIPPGTPHAGKVLSGKELRVISIQAPRFLGKDRVFLDESR